MQTPRGGSGFGSVPLIAGTLLAPQIPPPPPPLGLQPPPNPSFFPPSPLPPGCRVSCFHFARPTGWDRGLETEDGVQGQHRWQRGQPEDAGEPNALFSSLSHVRDFLPLDGGIRVKKSLRERRTSTGENFLPGFLAPGRFVLGLGMSGISTDVFAPFLPLMLSPLPYSMFLPAPQNEMPRNILCPLCGCRGTCWGLSWDTLSHDQQQSRSRLGKEKISAIMGTQKSQLLSKSHLLSAQIPPCSTCWGAETPM